MARKKAQGNRLIAPGSNTEPIVINRDEPITIVEDKEANDPASIFPVQLKHLTSPSSNSTIDPIATLQRVDLAEVEYEDCTAYINLDSLISHSHHVERAEAKDIDSVDAALGSVKKENGESSSQVVNGANLKRELSPSFEVTSIKRAKTEHNEQMFISTACRFEVLMRNNNDKNMARKLKSRMSRLASNHRISAVDSIGRIIYEPLPKNRSNDGLICAFIRVQNTSGTTIAHLPILDSSRVSDATQEIHRYSNGPWLESLCLLSGGEVNKPFSRKTLIRTEARLDMVFDGPTGFCDSFEEAFVLELRLRVFLRSDLQNAVWTLENAVQAEHFDRLIHFAFTNDDEESTVRSHDQIDASIFYKALRSSDARSESPLDVLQPRLLNAQLFPFQRESVRFLLEREGKTLVQEMKDDTASLVPISRADRQNLGLFWRQIAPDLYFNSFAGAITSNHALTQVDDTHGGILAEEMGLGKTVEIFALILLNGDERRSEEAAYFDHSLEVEVFPTKTTLIVAPEVLRQQWLDEATLHTPELRAFSYLGYKEANKEIPDGKTWPEFARTFDIIVVSFDTLRKELVVARKEPQRSRRFERKYERPRSLLIQLAFHRVVMDEVQLVGHASAAETVSMIARNYSIAVSGTPFKQMSDIHSLFKFLRVPGPIHSNPYWQRLLQPSMISTLMTAMGRLAVRHTKSQVRQEMALPEQTRVLVPVHFTAVESTFYRDIYQKLLSSIGIDSSNFASRKELLRHVYSTYGEDVGQLRTTLLALRQACTHPQIAGSGVRGTALAASQTIRSMEEVLTIMIEGSRSEFDSIWHSLIQKRIDRAVLMLQRKEDDGRHDIAKAMLMAVQEDVKNRIDAVKLNLENAKRVGPLYKFSKAELADLRNMDFGTDGDVEMTPLDNQKEADARLPIDRDREVELSEKRMQRRRHMTALQQRLRNYLEQYHRCHHFLGNIYFQMGEKIRETATQIEPAEDGRQEEAVKVHDSATSILQQTDAKLDALKKQEDESYDKAEDVRQELLKDRRKAVEQALSTCVSTALDFGIEDLYGQENFGIGGIKSSSQFDQLKRLQDRLNAQSDVIFEWREKIRKRLEKPVNRVVSAEDENDDQYQENLDAQAEAEALLEMYRVLLSEREFMLTNVRIEGTLGRPQLYAQLEREVPQYERAQRRIMLQQASGTEVVRNEVFADDWLPSEQEIGVMRQQLDHLRQLEIQKNRVSISREAQRAGMRSRAHRVQQDQESGEIANRTDEDLFEFSDLQPFELILKDMREIVQSIDGREEVMIIRMGIDQTRKMIANQKTLLEKMKKESATFSAAWNARAAYFKQIQDLSDQVADIILSGNMSIQERLGNFEREEATLKRRQELCAGRLRYLCAIEEEEGEEDEDDRDSHPITSTPEEGREDDNAAKRGRNCPICTEPMVKAIVLDTCGHVVCESCHLRWTALRGQCPMCKAQVNLRNVYRVTYGQKGKKRQRDQPGSDKDILQRKYFNVIDDTSLLAIQRMPIRSTLGSKLDLLTRHLLYIESTEPGTKSLIFTAFSRGINLVGDALRLNGIKFVTLDQGGVRGGRIIDHFKNDADTNVLLLHSEAQSSGLNLVCAQNIFLLEPLVNHALELQAIGRVHRIGQMKTTTVFCYQVIDTVEQRIVNLARKRHQSLFTREHCVSNDLKDSAELVAKAQESKSQQKGFVLNGSRKDKEGEYVAQLVDVITCLFGDEEEHEAEQRGGHQTTLTNANAASGSSSTADTSAQQIDISSPPTPAFNADAVQSTHASNADAVQSHMESLRQQRLLAIEKRRHDQSQG
ncbi:uncharacterized protein FA14DRAFT_161739 [Meira miltonrushii]|uniref:RING-type domain-containing protein n=1 Tax=Meira miltonrushii TaxID=1280837 RepID=A0A316V9X3_9BASI|nr:uncharacterized protein FA14DRAFT_161739 [Meira miltonrushii]PWN34296.1 hypothetical protein FA14DRAFT_161739 [Meira miltonrushii]